MCRACPAPAGRRRPPGAPGTDAEHVLVDQHHRVGLSARGASRPDTAWRLWSKWRNELGPIGGSAAMSMTHGWRRSVARVAQAMTTKRVPPVLGQLALGHVVLGHHRVDDEHEQLGLGADVVVERHRAGAWLPGEAPHRQRGEASWSAMRTAEAASSSRLSQRGAGRGRPARVHRSRRPPLGGGSARPPPAWCWPRSCSAAFSTSLDTTRSRSDSPPGCGRSGCPRSAAPPAAPVAPQALLVAATTSTATLIAIVAFHSYSVPLR